MVDQDLGGVRPGCGPALLVTAVQLAELAEEVVRVSPDLPCAAAAQVIALYVGEQLQAAGAKLLLLCCRKGLQLRCVCAAKPQLLYGDAGYLRVCKRLTLV